MLIFKIGSIFMNKEHKFLSAFLPLIFLIILCFFIRIPILSNKLMIILGVTICCILAFIQKKILIQLRELLLFTSLTAFALITHRSTLDTLYIILLPTIFSFLGKYLICICDPLNKTYQEKSLYLMISPIIIGYSIHGVLNSILFLRNGSSPAGRAWLDIWDGTTPPATQQILYFLPVMAMFFPAFLFIKRYLLVSIIIFLSNSFFLYISVITKSRTSLVVFVLLLMVEFSFWCFLNRHNTDYWGKKRKKSLHISLIIFIILSIVIFSLLKNNILASQSNWLNRDGGILNNIRFKAQFNVIKQIPLYPMGGYEMDLIGLSYAHNVWLDLANAAGWIPFILFTLYTILSLIDIFQLLKLNNISPEAKCTLLGLYLAFLLYYMVEPALEASVLYIVPWCFINSTIYGFLASKK